MNVQQAMVEKFNTQHNENSTLNKAILNKIDHYLKNDKNSLQFILNVQSEYTALTATTLQPSILSNDNKNYITVEQALEQCTSFLNNTGKGTFYFKNNNFHKSLTTVLLKNHPEEEQLNSIFTTFILPGLSQTHKQADLIHLISKAGNEEFNKNFIFTVLNTCQTVPLGLVKSYKEQEENVIKTLKALGNLNLSKDEYPIILNFLDKFEYCFSNAQLGLIGKMNEFLKATIPVEDWKIFSKFTSRNPENQLLAKTTNMFSINPQPVLNFNLNEDAIINNYPILSLSSDCMTMVGTIKDLFSTHAKKMGIESCHFSKSIKTSEGTIYPLHFTSNNMAMPDAKIITRTIETFIQHYTEAMSVNQHKNQPFIKQAFLAAMLDGNLNETNIEKKRHKI
jgi:hypothetical protein